MKYAALVATVLVSACGSSSPTAPTPPVAVTPPVVTPPPVVIPPPVVTPSPPILPVFPPNDPRFDLRFYRMFVHDALERFGDTAPLLRQSVAPRIYLRTIDDAGTPIDALTLNGTAAAIERVTGQLTGTFGIAGLERGTDTRYGQRGWVTVSWSATPGQFCGVGYIGGDRMVLYPRTAGCRCGGGPAIAPLIVKHEMGHVLGFRHTDQRTDLMHPGGGGLPACDMDPSPREIYHAAIAYQRPVGSPAP